MSLEVITLEESERLVRLEATIHQGKAVFMQVAEAMAEIRDSRLYRNQYNTFEEYCQKTWGWGRNYVNKMIASGNAVKSLTPGMGTIVPTEAAAREVAKIPQANRAEVLQKITDAGKPVTAKAIRASAQPAAVDDQDDDPGFTPDDVATEADELFARVAARAEQLADGDAYQVIQWIMGKAHTTDIKGRDFLAQIFDRAMDSLGGGR
jgi:hypothetical protein